MLKFKNKKMTERFLPDVAKNVKQETEQIKKRAEAIDFKLRDKEATVKMKKEMEQIKRKEAEERELGIATGRIPEDQEEEQMPDGKMAIEE